MGARERRKGAVGEREAVNLLRGYGLKAKRRGALQAGRGKEQEADLPDVVIEGSPFWIEVKRGKLVSVRAAFRQAEREAPLGDVPLVMWRDDGASG